MVLILGVGGDQVVWHDHPVLPLYGWLVCLGLPPEDLVLIIGGGLPQGVDTVSSARLSTVATKELSQAVSSAVTSLVATRSPLPWQAITLARPCPVDRHGGALPFPLHMVWWEDEVSFGASLDLTFHMVGYGSQLRVDLSMREDPSVSWLLESRL